MLPMKHFGASVCRLFRLAGGLPRLIRRALHPVCIYEMRMHFTQFGS